jgi:tetratricopeptide (TPR) repeat protein
VKEYEKVLLIQPQNAAACNNLGAVYLLQGEFDEAIKYFTEALRTKPDFAEAHINLGHAMALKGNLDEAAVHLAEALRLNSNSALAHYYIGQVLAQKYKIDDAIAHFEEALRLKPDWDEPMNDLAWFLAASKKTTIHNPDKAVGLAQRACELTGYKKPELLDTLAVAYAAAGDFDKAVETAEKALELCRSSEQQLLKEEIENRLALYKVGKPYIETR